MPQQQIPSRAAWLRMQKVDQTLPLRVAQIIVERDQFSGQLRHDSRSHNGVSMNFQAIGIIAIVVGVGMEIFMIGSEFSAGTIIAMLGILAFVYGYFNK